MGIGYAITEHEKLFLNDKGEEVYPPGHPNVGMVKPAGERKRDPGLPPKSKAEERLELASKIDDEAQKAMETLASKGIKVSIA